MNRSCRGTLGPLLAVVYIAYSCSSLATAQNNAASAAVAEQLQHMQQQLNQQQQQINQLQGELQEARQQLKAFSGGTSSQPGLVSASYSEPSPAVAVAAAPEGPPSAPTVIPAIAPLRTLPVDPPKTGGLVPGIKLGPVTLTPYGFIKATGVHDTSNPNGDDFPFVGLFLTQNSIAANNLLTAGPTKDPAFFVKARATRFGTNIEWPDVSKKLTLTGRIEGDFEGNFNESDNRDVSSIRSNNPNLRLAFVRMDYHASDTTEIYFEGGQDWTLFGSSALPPILETTFLMAYYGAVYERSPQLLGGFVHTPTPWRNLKLSGTFGIMMPTSSQIEKLSEVNGLAGFEAQIGQAEREGADSGRPEVEGRVALQFQLDQAKGVAPAQILVSGFQGRRKSIVPSTDPSNSYCGLLGTCFVPGNYETSFPNGFTASSQMYGGQIAVQLPTRWATLVASAYRGGDLRFFFGGQVNSYATDLSGLSNPVSYTTLDGGPLAAAGTAVLATNSAGAVVVAPQRPIRSFGGFVSAGFPLSRIFNANPAGRNAGWQLYLTAGKDQVVHRDLLNQNYDQLVGNILSPLPLLMGKMAALSVFYKLNQWASFGFEQSIYATRLEPADGGLFSGISYSIAGKASNEWQDHRTEFGPIFTF
jgi:hypothetical protein